jgi:hypothetical protein
VKRLLLLFAVGCGRGPQQFANTFDPCTPIRLVVPADVTASQLASVRDAIAMWQAVAPVHLSLDAGPDQRELPIIFEGAASAFYGVYEDRVPQISINIDLSDERARAVVLAHELGHAMDLFHVYGRPSVMNTPNQKTAPNAEDGATLLATWGECVSPAAAR